MKPLPYRWLPGDHPEITKMSHEQHSCYRLLFDAAWTLGGLPDDVEELARICLRYPLSEFKKEIWPKIKHLFYPNIVDGKLWSFDLEFQRDALEKVRLSQSKRASRPRKKPPANRRVATGKPPDNNSEVVFGPANITESPRLADGLPPDNLRLQKISQSEILITAGYPPDSPRIADGSDEKVEIFTKAPAEIPENIVARETAGNIQKMSAEMSAEIDPYFDRLAAWENFAAKYPEPGLVHKNESMAAFFKIVINEFWEKQFLRAFENFSAHLEKEGWEAQEFIYWLPEWKAWEDPKE